MQRVVLNCQSSEWLPINAGVPQGSMPAPLFFLVYINDLSEGIKSTAKLFADDTSLFSKISKSETTANKLNQDLQKIASWAYKWKLSFNPDPVKQAQEVIFSRKFTKENHIPISFNNSPIQTTRFQKHLGIYLDEKLNFKKHLEEKIAKANRGD